MNGKNHRRTVVTLLGIPLALALGCSSTKSGTSTASAGSDQKVLVGDAVALDGSGSTVLKNQAWSFVSRPSGSAAALSNAKKISASFTADVAGEYVLSLSVDDGASTDTVTVTAKTVLALITLGNGSAISTRQRHNRTEYVMDLDQEGGILSGATSRTTGTVASYTWSQVSGPGATQVSAALTEETLAFTAPGLLKIQQVGRSADPAHPKDSSDQYKWQPLPVSPEDTRLIFKLAVTDSSGNSDAATFTMYLQDAGAVIWPTTGLDNVGVGTTVYLAGPNLKAEANSASSAVDDWAWSLTRPSGSSATFADTGTTSSAVQFPRFVADVAGLYVVAYSSNDTASGELRINAGTYVGVGTIGGTSPRAPQCGTCHNGVIEPDITSAWSATGHATIFQQNVATYAGLAPEPYCWECHTVGYNPQAGNNGFDDLVAAAGFEFPEEGISYQSFTSGYAGIAKLANVQCENCHGPGSLHNGSPTAIAFSYAQTGVCGQCHSQEAEWINSAHNSTGVAHGAGRYRDYWVSTLGCLRCHNAQGFVTYLEEGRGEIKADTTYGAFPGITCAACHDPHDATNPAQLRAYGDVTMLIGGGTVNAGRAAVCYTCHDGLYSYSEQYCDVDRNGSVNEADDGEGVVDGVCLTVEHSADFFFRQVHYNPQGSVLEGLGAITDIDKNGTADFTLTENSFHSASNFILSAVTGDTTLASENNKCVTCHMWPGPAADEEGYLHIGGHAFAQRKGHGIGHLAGEETEPGALLSATEIENIGACQACHVGITEFNRPARADYDGDGTIEGVQDEVKGLLLKVADLIRALDTDDKLNKTATSGTQTISDEIVPLAFAYKGVSSSAQDSSFRAVNSDATTANTIRRAIWNHNLIVRDASLGVHNMAFNVQLLQGTYGSVMKALGPTCAGSPKVCSLTPTQTCSTVSDCYKVPNATIR